MVHSTLLLALAAAVSAEKLTGFMHKPQRQANLLPVGISNEALNMGLEGSCLSLQKVCDTDFCIPSISTCCGNGNGAYCELGKTCVPNGCCPIGKRCTGPTTCEDDDEKVCGTFCIPKDADCCDDDKGLFCDSPNSCTSSGCSGGGELRGGPGRSGGGGSSGGSDDDDDSGSGGSGGSGGSSDEEQCFSFQEECGTGCMPRGSVCCSNGMEYCLAGQTCNNDGTCRRGGLGGSGGSGGSSDDDDDDDDEFTFTRTTFGSSSEPTTTIGGGSSDDDDDDDSSPAPSSGGGNSNSNNDDDDDDTPRSGDDGDSSNSNDDGGEADAAVAHGPSLFAAAVALIPLLL